MYSIEEAKELFTGGGIVKIKFRKSLKPLSVFDGLTADEVNVTNPESWRFPKSDVWLNVSIPSEDDFCKKLDISVGFTGVLYCLLICVAPPVGLGGYHLYREFYTLEDVYTYILDFVINSGDPDVYPRYVVC